MLVGAQLADEDLKESPIEINNRAIYVIVEPTPTDRLRNRMIGRAMSVIEEMLDDTTKLTMDFRAGIAYWAAEGKDEKDVNKLLPIGRKDVKGWQWITKNIEKVLPDLDIASLAAKAAEILSE